MSSNKRVERAMNTLTACIRDLMRENEVLRGYLQRITEYQSVERLRKNSEKDWACSFEEALEMAYENVQTEAKNALLWKPRVLTSQDIEKIGQKATENGSAIIRESQRS